MVSNINAGGMAVDGSLMLGRAEVEGAADNAAMTRTGFMGDTSGTLAGRAMEGEWGGQFYGPNDASATGTAADRPNIPRPRPAPSALTPRAIALTRLESSAPSARGRPSKEIDSAFEYTGPTPGCYAARGRGLLLKNASPAPSSFLVQQKIKGR